MIYKTGWFQPLAYLCLLCLSAEPSFAEADGPDFWQTQSQANIHCEPTQNSPVLHIIPKDTPGLANRGCVGVPTYRQWIEMNEKERQKARNSAWCKIAFQGHLGWVLKSNLMEGPRP